MHFTLQFSTLNVRKLLIIAAIFIAGSQAATAQNNYWSKATTYPGFNYPYFLETQQDKGLWYAGANGIAFTDLNTKKTTTYAADAAGRAFGFVRSMEVYGNDVYACNDSTIYKLDRLANKFVAYTLPPVAAYNKWKYLYATEKGLAAGGDRSCVFFIDGKPNVINYPPGAEKLLDRKFQPFFAFNIGGKILYSLGGRRGIFLSDIVAKTDVAIFQNENVVAGYYEPGKGVWMKSSNNILFVSGDGAQKLMMPLQKIPETTDRMLQDANGKVYVFGSKNVYELLINGTGSVAAINAVVTKKISPLGYNLQNVPLAIGTNGGMFYGDGYGIHKLINNKEETLVRNPLPMASVTQWNSLMPDGKFYRIDGSKLYIFDGKGEVIETATTGSGSTLATDGKDIYMGAYDALQRKNGVNKFETIASLPINIASIAAGTDGKIYFAGRDGLGYVQQGKVTLVKKESIPGFPNNGIQSMAVNKKNELLIFTDSMYRYTDGKLIGVPGTKMSTYLHYFDNKGGQYSAGGMSDKFYLKGNTAVKMEAIIRQAYNLPAKDYVNLGEMAMDYKGRLWLLAGYQKKNYLLLLEDGKVTNRFDESQVPILSASFPNIFSDKKKLYIGQTAKGLVVYDLK